MRPLLFCFLVFFCGFVTCCSDGLYRNGTFSNCLPCPGSTYSFGGTATSAGDCRLFPNVADLVIRGDGGLNEGKWWITAVTLGVTGIFAGGINGSGLATTQVDFYDSSTNVWSRNPNGLSVPRTYLTGASTGSKVAVFAGGLFKGASSDVVDIYDAANIVWTTATLSQPKHLVSAAAISGRAGLIFFAGGASTQSKSVLRTVEVYNVLNEQWTVFTNALSRGRCLITSVAVGGLSGAVVLFAGGTTQSVGPGWSRITTTVATVDIVTLDPRIGNYTWTTSTLAIGRCFMGAVAVGSKAIFAGGWKGGSKSAAVDIYDTITKTWSKSGIAVGSGLFAPACAALGNKAFFFGGSNDDLFSNRGLSASNAIFVFDFSTNIMTKLNLQLSLARAFYSNSAVTLPGGIIVIAGGRNPSFAALTVDYMQFNSTAL